MYIINTNSILGNGNATLLTIIMLLLLENLRGTFKLCH